MTISKAFLVAAGLTSGVLLIGPTLAAASGHMHMTHEQKVAMHEISKTCKAKADAQGLHGKEHKHFKYECMNAAMHSMPAKATQ